MLDKLFSREINRRTGAHAINIYIETSTANRRKKRSRAIGSQAIEASKTKTTITTKQQHSFFYRLNVRFPWLKLVATLAISLIIVLDLLSLTISKTNDPYNKIRIAPMSHHVQTT